MNVEYLAAIYSFVEWVFFIYCAIRLMIDVHFCMLDIVYVSVHCMEYQSGCLLKNVKIKCRGRFGHHSPN